MFLHPGPHVPSLHTLSYIRMTRVSWLLYWKSNRLAILHPGYWYCINEACFTDISGICFILIVSFIPVTATHLLFSYSLKIVKILRTFPAYVWNIMFISDRCHHSYAMATTCEIWTCLKGFKRYLFQIANIPKGREITNGVLGTRSPDIVVLDM